MTMRCSSCQFDNPPAMKFCGQCGAQLTQLCPRCGAENQPTFKFCGQCGAALTASQPPGAGTAGDLDHISRPPEAKRQGYTPPHLAEKILRSRSALEGERRHVTVLFADMTGFTPLAEKLDPEEVHQIIDRCFELITAEVHRFEGTINQYTGDGVMALFGAPVHAFEVLRPRGRRMRFDVAVERGLTPLVGRERELGLLLDRFGAVKAGRGQVVFITGEAGIGKSRLVLECRRALAASGEVVTRLERRRPPLRE